MTERLRPMEKELPGGAEDPFHSCRGPNRFPWPFDPASRKTSQARDPAPHTAWHKRTARELTATSNGRWPNGDPLLSEGEFSCQEGVLLRIGRPLTVQQLITTKQNAGQCTAAVNKVWRRRQAQREYEEEIQGVHDLSWDLQPQEDLETRLMKAKLGDKNAGSRRSNMQGIKE